jgi:Domain of unknown function (DUF397)
MVWQLKFRNVTGLRGVRKNLLSQRISAFSAHNGNCVVLTHGTLRRSSHSAYNDNCAETGSVLRRSLNSAATCYLVQDSKNPLGPGIGLAPEDLTSLLKALK